MVILMDEFSYINLHGVTQLDYKNTRGMVTIHYISI